MMSHPIVSRCVTVNHHSSDACTSSSVCAIANQLELVVAVGDDAAVQRQDENRKRRRGG